MSGWWITEPAWGDDAHVFARRVVKGFETLGARLVGWRTDNLNAASQAAIERLGARKDGVIRHHALRRDGTVRDTVMYSVTVDEWPAIRASLEARLLAG